MSLHIDVLKLLDLSREKVVLDRSEQSHLRECEECQTLLGVFIRQQGSLRNGKPDGTNGGPLKETA